MSILKIVSYNTKTGKEPFTQWLNDLDSKTRTIILTRISRVRFGNFGDCKLIKGSSGIWELRIDYGPGFRIYFGKQGLFLIILLLGGNKGSQARDIIKAKLYWIEYQRDEYEK